MFEKTLSFVKNKLGLEDKDELGHSCRHKDNDDPFGLEDGLEEIKLSPF